MGDRHPDFLMNDSPYMFIAEMLSSNVVQYKGARFEVFLTWESSGLELAAGDRVQCMLIKQTHEIFVVARASA